MFQIRRPLFEKYIRLSKLIAQQVTPSGRSATFGRLRSPDEFLALCEKD